MMPPSDLLQLQRWMSDGFDALRQDIAGVKGDLVVMRVEFKNYCDDHGEEMSKHMRAFHPSIGKSIKRILVGAGIGLGVFLTILEILKMLGVTA